MRRVGLAAVALLVCVEGAAAQVDQQRAATYFREAAALCEREGGRLWGVSLCGPIALADPVTHTIATNQPAPQVKQPPALGYANAAMDWGGTRWTTLVWAGVPEDPRLRGILLLHELFHRIQPQLGLLLPEPSNDHLDTPDGRYWLQLEWRALARALILAGPLREASVRDALAFRLARRTLFPGAAANERVLEINEGLAQYTATVAGTDSVAEAVADAIDQLTRAAQNQTFIRTFAYASGAAYGILLDASVPGWTHRLKPTDDLGLLAAAAAQLQPAPDAAAAARWYGGPALRLSEGLREAERAARVAELRKRFVDGPVLTTPGSNNSSFVTNGMTPIPGAGVTYNTFRATAVWGTLTATTVLMSADRESLTVPAPASIVGTTLSGDGWTLTIAPGWVVRPGARPGDFQLVRER